MVDLDYALSTAKLILKKRPHFYLCGSTALLLAKVIPKRQVGDLDFICFDKYFDEGTVQVTYHPDERDGYKCFKVVQDHIAKGFYYNVFVHNNNTKIITDIVEGVRIQNIQQILDWKIKWNRNKDRKDLNLDEFIW